MVGTEAHSEDRIEDGLLTTIVVPAVTVEESLVTYVVRERSHLMNRDSHDSLTQATKTVTSQDQNPS